MTNEANNFWKTYLNEEDDDIKETRDFLKKAGVNIDKARNEFSELLRVKGEEIKEEAARERKQRGKRKQEEFDRYFKDGKIYRAEESEAYAYQTQFRDEKEINVDDRKKTEEKDKRAMDVLKKLNKKGGIE